MDKKLEILGKVVEIIGNRRLMTLIAGIAAALLVLSYVLPPSLVMWPWERGVEKLVRGGILVCSDADPGNKMRAYSLSADAERYLAQHRGSLRWVDQSKKPNN